MDLECFFQLQSNCTEVPAEWFECFYFLFLGAITDVGGTDMLFCIIRRLSHTTGSVEDLHLTCCLSESWIVVRLPKDVLINTAISQGVPY
jgi:hypothetical protein